MPYKTFPPVAKYLSINVLGVNTSKFPYFLAVFAKTPIPFFFISECFLVITAPCLVFISYSKELSTLLTLITLPWPLLPFTSFHTTSSPLFALGLVTGFSLTFPAAVSTTADLGLPFNTSAFLALALALVSASFCLLINMFNFFCKSKIAVSAIFCKIWLLPSLPFLIVSILSCKEDILVCNSVGFTSSLVLLSGTLTSSPPFSRWLCTSLGTFSFPCVPLFWIPFSVSLFCFLISCNLFFTCSPLNAVGVCSTSSLGVSLRDCSVAFVMPGPAISYSPNTVCTTSL